MARKSSDRGGVASGWAGRRTGGRRRGRWERTRPLAGERLESRQLLSVAASPPWNLADGLDGRVSYVADGQRIELAVQGQEYAVKLRGSDAGGLLTKLTALGGPLDGFDAGQRVTGDVYLLQGDDAPLDALKDESLVWAVPAYVTKGSRNTVLVLDEAVVALQPGVAPGQVFGASVVSYRPLPGTPDQFVVTLGGAGQATLDYANRMMLDKRVAWATPNLYQHMEKMFTPNDTLFPNQWHLNNTGSNSGQSGALVGADVHSVAAWDFSTGVGVTIAVLDDGIERTHPDLAANIFVNPGEVAGNGIDDDGNGWVDDVSGWSFANNSPDPTQGNDNMHGTSTSGIAAASGNNSLGVTGSAFNAKILPVQMFDGGLYVGDAQTASAIYYGAGRTADGLRTWNAAQVMSCSWGGGAPSTTLTDAFTWASTTARGGKGLPIFISSGNGYSSTVSYPANLSATLPGVMAVGASNDIDRRSGYSNYGTALDFVAPSSDFNRTPGGDSLSLATTTTDRTGSRGYNPAASPAGDYTTNQYVTGFGGTSSAAPLAAGVGALVLSYDPTLTSAQVKQLLRATADKVGGVVYDPNGFHLEYGYGRVNALAALQQLGLRVIGSQPADGATVSSPPALVGGYLADFSQPFSQTPSDIVGSAFQVNGVPASSYTIVDADTIQFNFTVQPVTAQGLQTMEIAAGSLKRLSDGAPLLAWTGHFRYDVTPLTVTATVPAAGSVVTMPFTALQLDFNEAVDPASVDAGDLVLSQGQVTQAMPADADSVVYTLAGITQEASFTWELPAGRVADTYGNPNVTGSGAFILDFGVVPYPTPLEAKPPLGSWIYDPVATGNIGVAGDTDGFTIELDAGQTVTVVALPDAALRPGVQVTAPDGGTSSAEAGGAGQEVVLANVVAADAGTYTITVSGAGGSTGVYALQLILNADVEVEQHGGAANDTQATAQDLGPALHALGAGSGEMGAVLGYIPLNISTVYSANMDADPGWTLQGEWAYGVPAGVGGDPVSGYTGDNVIGYNLNGAYPNSMPVYSATTPAFSTVGYRGLTLSFERWLGVESSFFDHAAVQVSNDGTNWADVWSHTADSFQDTSWSLQTYSLPALAENQPAVYLRWTMGPTDSSVTYSGWNLDDVHVYVASFAPPDYYAIDLEAGQALTVVAASLGGGSVDIELQDPAGTPVARSKAAGNADAVVNGLVAPAAGTYYVRVSGVGEYSLVAVREGEFDTEPNDDLEAAQDITATGIAAGYVRGRTASSGFAPRGVAALDYPRGTAAPSLGAASLVRGGGRAGGGIGTSAIEGAAYGTEAWNEFFARFDLSAPETLANIGPQSAGFIGAGDFDESGDFSTAYAIDGSNNFVAINTDTGAMTTIGVATPVSGQTFVGMAGDPASGDMYVGSTDISTSYLYTIDIATGQTTVVGQVTNSPGLIAIAADGDGQLYGHDIVTDQFLRIDKGTGAGTVVGPLGFDANFGQGMDFDSKSGQMYLAAVNNSTFAAELRIADLETGATTLVGVLGSEYPGDCQLGWLGIAAVGVNDDYYRFQAVAGDELVITTTTPGGGLGEFVNVLDPAIELYDPAGTKVGENDNGAGDNRNARLTHTAALTGTYVVRVLAAADRGEYVLRVEGATGELPAFEVAAIDPPDGTRTQVSPTEITVDFNDALLLTTLQASDLTVGGVPATGVTVVDADTAVFTIPAGLAEGTYPLALPAGSILDLQGTPLSAFASTLVIDRTGPRIVASSVQENEVVAAGGWTYTAVFDEELAAVGLDAADLRLVGQHSGSHAPATFQYVSAPSTLMLQFDNLPDDAYTLILTSGAAAFRDLAGNLLDGEPVAFPIPPQRSGDGTPGGDFVVHFAADLDTGPFPLPLAAEPPLGSLVYQGQLAGAVTPSGDADNYTLALDAGQTVSVVLQTAAGVTAVVELRAPDNRLLGSAAAATAGQTIVLQTLPAADAGTYTLSVTGTTPASLAEPVTYLAQVFLNQALEAESYGGPQNDTLATAQALEPAFIGLAGGAADRAAVAGALPRGVSGGYTAYGVPYAFEDISETGTSILSGADDGYTELTDAALGDFQFPFYGTVYSNLFVSSNGLITFGSGTSSLSNGDLTDSPAQAAIAVLWDDLYIGSSGTNPSLRWQVLGSGSSERLVIQWNNIRYYSGSDPITFEAVLSEADGSIQLNYQDITDTTSARNNGAQASVGIKAADAQGPDRLLLLYNNGPNEYVATGVSTQIVYRPPAAPEDWYSFPLAAGQAATLALAGGATLELYDASGTWLASGVGAGNVSQVIPYFVAPAAGTYYARVTGSNADYRLVVTRDAGFDTEANDTADEAQDISGLGTVLGAVDDQTGWTFMVMLDGDCNLEDAGIDDFLEMSSIGSSDEVNIVVQFDRISGYDSRYGDWTGTRRGRIELGDVPEATWGLDVGEVNMGDPDSVAAFVQWAIAEYPAQRYALVLWDHGGGFYGCLWDDTDGDHLSMADLDAALSGVPHLDLVGFDACLMGMAEIAYQVAEYADVMVASEETIPWDGWEYQWFLDDLVASPAMDAAALAGVIVDAYEARYPEDPFSAIDLAALGGAAGGLVGELGDFADLMLTTATGADWGAVQAARNSAQAFADDDFRDVGGFLGHVAASGAAAAIRTAAEDANAALAAAVLQLYAGSYEATGLSIYLPGLGGGVSGSYDDSLRFVAETQWEDFLDQLTVSHAAGSGVAAVRGGKTDGKQAGPLAGQSVRPPGQRGVGRFPTPADAGSVEPSASFSGFSGETSSGDWYQFAAASGDVLILETFTPAGGPNEFVNLLDPEIQLFDPSGTPIAYTNVPGNEFLQHTAVATGLYRVRVAGEVETTGEYVLRIRGSTLPNPAPFVSDSDPDEGIKLPVFPLTYTLDFSESMLISSLQPGDLIVGGLPATGLTVIDGDTFQFTIDPAAAAGDGVYAVAMAAGAATDLQGQGNLAFSATFLLDTTGPIITATAWNGAALPASRMLPEGPLTVDVTFNEPLRAPGGDDVVLVEALTGTVLHPQVAGMTGTTFTAQFTAAVPEGLYTLRLVSGGGAFEDEVGNALDGEPLGAGLDGTPTGDGTPGGDYTIVFSVDRVVPVSAEPFVRLAPYGSLAFASLGNTGLINVAGDQDDFSFYLEGGQSIAAVATPDDPAAALTLALNGGPPAVGTAGQSVVLPMEWVAAGGLQNLQVSGDVQTTFTLGIYRNGMLERAVGDTDEAHPLPLDVSYFALSGGGGDSGRFAALGTSSPELTELLLYAADMSADPLWTLQGQWAYGTPMGFAGDPSSGATGPNVIGYNLSGAYDNSMAATYAVTPPFSTVGSSTVTLDFQSWLGVESASYDHATVAVSNDGATWTTVWDHTGSSFQDTSWRRQTFDISTVAANQPTVSLRWTMGPTDGSVTYGGWNIDDVAVTGGFPIPDIDAYTVDLSGKAGRWIDVLLAGQDGADFSGDVLELLSPEGTVLATAVADPLGVEAKNYDLGILGFQVPAWANNVYRLRLTSTTTGEYALVIADAVTFDSEPNDALTDPLRGLNETGAALGFLPPAGLGPNVIRDGGFEMGPFGGVWDEYSTNFRTPVCDVVNCGTGGGSGPHSGTYWTWFGGIDEFEEGYVAQDVPFPTEYATLSFFLEIPATSGATADYMELLIDGQSVFRVTGADAGSYPVYRQVFVDVSAFADGGVHDLEFFSQVLGSDITNFFVDDVALQSGLPLGASRGGPAAAAQDPADKGASAGGVQRLRGQRAAKELAAPQYLPPQQRLGTTAGFLSPPAPGAEPLDVALGYVRKQAAALGLTAADVDQLVVTDQYTTAHNGVTHIYLRQTLHGLPIANADMNVNVTADGRVINVGSTFVAGLADAVPGQFMCVAPQLSAAASLQALADTFGWTLDAPPAILSAATNLRQTTLLAAGGVSRQPIPAELQYVPTPGGVELAWQLIVQTADGRHWYDAGVSAVDGDVLYAADWVDEADYRAYPIPVESPNHGERILDTDPQDANASPYGWHDTDGAAGAEYTVTRGNNTFAYADRNDDDSPDAGSAPDGGASLAFDFPIDFGQQPLSYQPAAVTNLFYWTNLLHDVHYQYGFDEASGNFQVNNYGQGGLGDDALQAQAQDGADVGNRNNANMWTPPDGISPVMQMYLWSTSSPERDGDLDNGIIIHEFGHGVSNRLTGGPSNANALETIQSGGMGEGWSDWYALWFTQEAADTASESRGIGTYALNQPADGPGIRTQRYSYDMSIDDHTYADIRGSGSVHYVGETWASALWDLNWLLIAGSSLDPELPAGLGFDADLYGGSGGNNLAMQLITDGLKLQPASPSFLDGRDAILLADRLNYGGAHQLAIWKAFARRGMGYSASDGGGSTTTNVTEAFDLPSRPAGAVALDREYYGVGDPVTIEVRDLDLAGTGPLSITIVSDGGDEETVSLTEVALGAFRGTIATLGVPGNDQDGRLNVTTGDVLTVTYQDADDGTGTPAVVTDLATVVTFLELLNADFSDGVGDPFDEGFTSSGSANSWHLSVGRGSDSGHSADDSFYFGSGEGPTGGGSYSDNADGSLWSPPIDLWGYLAVTLTFNHFLSLEPGWDNAVVSVQHGSATTDLLALQNTTGFESVSVDLSDFAGEQIRVQFRFTSDISVTYEGWYVDDVVVSGAVLDPALVGPRVTATDPPAGRTEDLGITQIVVDFSEPVSRASGEDAANYALIGAGADGDLGTADDVAIAVSPALNAAGTVATLAIEPAFAPLAVGRYRLTLDGSSAQAIVDLDGNPLSSTTGPGGGRDTVHEFEVFFKFQAGGDMYTVDLEAGQIVLFQTVTPFADPAGQPANSLDPQLILFSPAGQPVARDADSWDGRNARLDWVVRQTGRHTIQVLAEQGAGEYLLRFSVLSTVVTNTQDSGPGSLRAALDAANRVPGAMTIRFAIPASDPGFFDADAWLPGGDAAPDVFVIHLASPLPALANPRATITIDGDTQAAFLAEDPNPRGPEIVVDGSGLAAYADGLTILSDGNTLRGLNVQGFPNAGIVLGGSHNSVSGVYVGTDPTGSAAAANGGPGILVFGAENIIGGSPRNVISGNLGDGVYLAWGAGNVLAGNDIGTDAAGLAVLPNATGIYLDHAQGTLIGGSLDANWNLAGGNLVSGNRYYGIYVGPGCRDTRIVGNYIGTDLTGSADLGNGYRGIEVNQATRTWIGGAGTGEGNVISGNDWHGVGVDGNDVPVRQWSAAQGGNGHFYLVLPPLDWDAAEQAAQVLGGHLASITSQAEQDFLRVSFLGDDGYVNDALWIGLNDIATEGQFVWSSGEPVGYSNWHGGEPDGGDLEDAVLINAYRGTPAEWGTWADGMREWQFRAVVELNSPPDAAALAEMLGSGNNVIAGNRIGTSRDGLVPLPNEFGGVQVWNSSGNVVGGAGPGEGNLISGNGSYGVWIGGSDARSNQVAGNVIGLQAGAGAVLGNAFSGVVVDQGSDNEIGPGNVISANGGPGVAIWGTSAAGNAVFENKIGTDGSGQLDFGNGSGVETGAAATTIRDNLISGNEGNGITLWAWDVPMFTWTGNGHTYVVAPPNSWSRAESLAVQLGGHLVTVDEQAEQDFIRQTILEGAFPEEPFWIGLNDRLREGTFTWSSGAPVAYTHWRTGQPDGERYENAVMINFVPGDPAGRGTWDDCPSGWEVRSILEFDVAPSPSDLLAALLVGGAVVQGNWIGLQASGSGDLGNGGGIGVYAPHNTIGGVNPDERNVVAFNRNGGITLEGVSSAFNTLLGNYIGTDPTGAWAWGNQGNGLSIGGGAHHNTVGGTVAGAANVISGNQVAGVGVFASGTSYNLVQGNLIGVQADGQTALPNAANGLSLSLGASFNTVDGNVIAGNGSSGIRVVDGGTDDNVLTGNFIGTERTGLLVLGNAGPGIEITNCARTQVGGVLPGQGNVIAHNLLSGVEVTYDTADGTTIRGNAIYANGWLGIDLDGDGVTPNDPADADLGANDRQNFPALSVVVAGAVTRITGQLNSAAGHAYALDFYAGAAADPSGYGEGARYLGSTLVTTGAHGRALFDVTLLAATAAGEVITATATDAGGSTSEFSLGAVAKAPAIVVLPGTSSDVTVRLNGVHLEVFDNLNQVALFSQPLDSVYSLSVIGMDGRDDRFVVDYDFGGFFELLGGLQVIGGAGASDLLVVRGEGDTLGNYVAEGGWGQATLETISGGQRTDIEFSGIEPLTIAGLVTLQFDVRGALDVGAQTFTMDVATVTGLDALTTLAGGTMTAPGGLGIGLGQSLIGYGTVAAPLAAAVGSTIRATDDLTLGDATAFDGFFSDGRLFAGPHTVTIYDADKAVLGALTVVGDSSHPGTLNAPRGLFLEDTKTLRGQGQVNTPDGQFKNNGYVHSEGSGLVFNHLVTGIGDFGGPTPVVFNGGYSPGLSPAQIDFLGGGIFTASNVLYIELGGREPGAQFDRLDVAGQAWLGGELDVDLIDGFVPVVGDRFEILTAADGVSGTFAAETLPALPAGRRWQVQYDSHNVTLVVVPATLIVTQTTPTPSGLVARFSNELKLPGLNLYDGAGGTLGAADVILTDGSGQTVVGSMMVADNRTAIEFVKTGGVLPPGTYSVTLKSGASAFRDLDDGLLDGNRDGTTGDDFTFSFTVAELSGRVVSLPDLARGAGQPVNVPNTVAGLPIRLSNADGVTSLAADLAYNPALLQITAATMAAGLPGDWSVTLDTGTAGVARIRASGTTALSGATVEVVRLTAAVPGNAPYGASQAIRLENVLLNGGAIAAVGDVAVHKAAYLGDADSSGIHSSADAFLVVQAALGSASGFAAHAWTDPRIVGDADGSGALSAADAFLIVQEGLGLAEPFVPDNPHITLTQVGAGVDPQFQIDLDIPATVGSLVTVPVKLGIEAAASNVGAFDFDLFFEPARLAIRVPDGVSAGADTAGWAMSAILVAPGHLRVGIVSASGQPLATGLREIARLQFHVEGGESSRTGWQPVPDGLPTRPTLLPPITDHRLPITDVSDGSETDPTWLDIEPVDPRAGGYTWTDADGSVLIRPAQRTLVGATQERIWRDVDAKADLLDSVLADLAHDVASAGR